MTVLLIAVGTIVAVVAFLAGWCRGYAVAWRAHQHRDIVLTPEGNHLLEIADRSLNSPPRSSSSPPPPPPSAKP